MPNEYSSMEIGNTHIKIFGDACRDRTEADVQEILRDIAKKTYEHLCAQTQEITPGENNFF